MSERTLVLIKPDGVARGLVGEVLGRIERKGFKIVALEMRTLTAAVAQERAPFSAERSWQIQRIAAPTVSPDGKTVVAAVTRYDLKDNKESLVTIF